VPQTVCLVVVADNDPFYQPLYQSHIPRVSTRTQQARAPPIFT
jgi:hypothetical protein